MTSCAFRALTPAVTAATLLALLAGPASVQARNPYRGAVVAAPSAYWGYAWNPYAWYGWDPVASELHGAASVIRAEGDFLVQEQHALLLREKVRRERMTTRRAELAQWEWERDFWAGSFNRKQASEFRTVLERSLAPNVSTGEIVYAISLNTLLTELERLPEVPAAGSTTIDPEVLAHIVFNTDGRGNAGLLKQDRLRWPELLRRPEYKDDRDAINRLFKQAKEWGISAQADSDEMAQTLRDLRHRLDDLHGRFTQAMRHQSHQFDPDWSTTYIRLAQNFFVDLEGSIRVLGKDDANFYLTSLQGKTVAELVKYMKTKGITFDRGINGSERYYKALHDALAGEYRRLHQPTLRTTEPK